MKIIARNLSRQTTEQELAQLFITYGKVQSCDLVLDQKTGGSKGFGFAVMPNENEAKAAIKALNGRTIKGNKIRVKKTNKT